MVSLSWDISKTLKVWRTDAMQRCGPEHLLVRTYREALEKFHWHCRIGKVTPIAASELRAIRYVNKHRGLLPPYIR